MNHKTLVALAAALSLATTTYANDFVKLEFTSPDGTEWGTKALAPYPESPVYLGQTNIYAGVNGIGTKTNYYNGAAYHIDVAKNELILGDGFEQGVLQFNEGGTWQPVDVGTYYGFCIDSHGRGWLASQENDGDPLYYLWQVNLSNGVCTLIDTISTYLDPLAVNGMVVTTLGF